MMVHDFGFAEEQVRAILHDPPRPVAPPARHLPDAEFGDQVERARWLIFSSAAISPAEATSAKVWRIVSLYSNYENRFSINSVGQLCT
ncbi:hypothetical protein X743_17580 [Mesorhizobium sp. LNHC252B00]|nr:hypothetical protein X743_17580 [Mesorhizobium sp. LNHC252B00]